MGIESLHLDWPQIIARSAEMQANIDARQLGDTVPLPAAEIVALYREYQQHKRSYEATQTERKEVARQLSMLRDASAKEPLVAQGKLLKARSALLEQERALLSQKLLHSAAFLPNFTDPAAPAGEQRVLCTLGDPLRAAALDPAVHSHEAIGQRLDLFMWEQAARATGARFAVLKRGAALLELALVQYALGRLSARHGFTPVLPPDLVRPRYAASCGFVPRGQHSQTYHVAEHDLCLAATSEISLAALCAERLLRAEELPLRLAAFSHCFRAEAGSQADERGLYRLHQFSKVEMFAVTAEAQSEAVHLECLEIQKQIIEDLGLHARVVDMPPHELGASASRKFDIEAYFPSRQSYREVTSASNCTSYQARRLLIRYDDAEGARRFAHTVNATAIAVPRVLMCILETHLQPDGRVMIPTPLLPFMHGLTHLEKPDLP